MFWCCFVNKSKSALSDVEKKEEPKEKHEENIIQEEMKKNA